MITNHTKYGLKAVLHLAKHDTSSLDDIADRETIAADALADIFQKLERAGFIKQASPDNVMLARPANQIMVGEVVRAIDGPLAPIPCVSHTAYERCNDCFSEEACEIRRLMRLVRDTTAFILDKTSILDMGAGRNPRVIFDDAGLELSPHHAGRGTGT
ncbi:transcriptional regulator [Paramagnetospirillum kuznetsovii]|uniref:Transcriptional regulator n=1 Tax=Paramagnetospirillum kuznetsovii TaxID=2053833 RepID=A0A364NTY9_9PROT|nr:Rrf2 family transcriptional regulator [Paramagnetospirillum kuznetsovii]RAU20536.1 transcriptional regulator [Paramagnetospirillum kuznetsovii]